MSIILKGIDLPDEKLMEIFESDNHIYIGGHYYPLMIKDVVQIPKDHGRLIDGDELVKHLRKDPLFDLVERYGVSGVIESRPTILDRERE